MSVCSKKWGIRGLQSSLRCGKPGPKALFVPLRLFQTRTSVGVGLEPPFASVFVDLPEIEKHLLQVAHLPPLLTGLQEGFD